MFRFEHLHFLWALLIIPILVVVYLLLQHRTKKKLTGYAQSNLLSSLIPQRSRGMKAFKFSMLMASLAAFIFTIANPQVGASLEKGKRKGVDIMICLDVSNSMLAEDIAPNRLDAAKMALSRFIDKLQGDRIGLVAFAGTAFVQLPITSDYAAAKMFIDRISTNAISQQGTDIANALDIAAVSMLPDDKDKEDLTQLNNLTAKVIVLVSDGEDQFEESVEMANKVNDFGITIHTMGIGSVQGTFIPEKKGNVTTGYKKDAAGNTVTTHLNEQTLKDVAQAGKGIYVHNDNVTLGFQTILDQIDKMTKVDLAEITFARYDSKFQYPLSIGLFFMLIYAFWGTKKWKLPRWMNLELLSFRAKSVILIGLLTLPAFGLNAQTDHELSAIRNGNNLYNQAEKSRSDAMELLKKGGEINQRNANAKMSEAAKNYQEAEKYFLKSMEKNKTWDKANYNLGNTLYRQERYDEAEKAFKNVADQSNSKLRANAYHNMGNSLLQQKKYQESIDAYKNALRIDPKNMDTKYNLEYAKKMLQMQQNQQNQQQNQKNQDQQQKDQQQSGAGQQNKDQKQDNKQKQPQSAEAQRKEQDQKRQLDALQQNEKNTQEKVQKQQNQQTTKQKQEKDW